MISEIIKYAGWLLEKKTEKWLLEKKPLPVAEGVFYLLVLEYMASNTSIFIFLIQVNRL